MKCSFSNNYAESTQDQFYLKNKCNYYDYNYSQYYGQFSTEYSGYQPGYYYQQNEFEVASNSQKENAIHSTQKKTSLSMLNAKGKGRVFYPSKAKQTLCENQNNSTPHVGQDPIQQKDMCSDSVCKSDSPLLGTEEKSISSTEFCNQDQAKNYDQSERKDLEEKIVLPSLIVEIVSNEEGTNYQFEVNDINKVFSKFGPVKSVEMIGGTKTKAIVTMENPSHGRQAEKCLNFYKLSNSDAYLTVKWNLNSCMSPTQKNISGLSVSNEKIEEQNQDVQDSHKDELDQNKESIKQKADIASQNDENYNKKIQSECMSVSKFTCKYVISISSVPGFSVARKIIGHRGK